MTAALALVLLHLAGAAAMAAVGAAAWARFAQAGLAAAALPVALLAAASGGLDPLARLLVPLVALLGATSAIAAAVAPEAGRPGPARVMQAAFQGVLGAVQAALLADGLLPAWGAVQAAVIAAVLLVAAQGSAAAIAAAWRMALPSVAGLALAAFGTLLLALAAEDDAARRLALRGVGAASDPGLRSLGVLFLVAGYGAVAGLVPLQAWRADAEAEAPPAMAPLLAVLLPIAALATMLRGLPLAAGPEPLLLAALGLLAVLFAAGALWTGRDARRLLAFAGVVQLGLAAVGFGIGAPLAGLLLLAGHALLLGGAGPAIGWASAGAGSRALRDVGGQLAARPALRAGVALAIAGLGGLPPFAAFLGGTALLVEAASRAPLLAVGLGAGMVAAAVGLVRAGAALCVAPPQPGAGPPRAIVAILWLYLLLAAIAGVFAPDAVAALFADAAAVLR